MTVQYDMKPCCQTAAILMAREIIIIIITVMTVWSEPCGQIAAIARPTVKTTIIISVMPHLNHFQGRILSTCGSTEAVKI
jgi:hypothetical protein